MNAFFIHNMLWNHVDLVLKSFWQRCRLLDEEKNKFKHLGIHKMGNRLVIKDCRFDANGKKSEEYLLSLSSSNHFKQW